MRCTEGRALNSCLSSVKYRSRDLGSKGENPDENVLPTRLCEQVQIQPLLHQTKPSHGSVKARSSVNKQTLLSASGHGKNTPGSPAQKVSKRLFTIIFPSQSGDRTRVGCRCTLAPPCPVLRDDSCPREQLPPHHPSPPAHKPLDECTSSYFL